jgi:excisionase family DNA binding protein
MTQFTYQRLLITVAEAAKMLSISTTTLYDQMRYEGFPVVRFGKLVRICPSDMYTWLEKRKEQEAE